MYAGDNSVSKGPRRMKWPWGATALVGVILGAAAVIFLWQGVLRSLTSTQRYSPSRPPIPLPAAYYEEVEAQIASGLGITVAQEKAGIEVSSREGLFGVATGRGTSLEPLYTIELGALQIVGDQMLTTGLWTQQQAAATMQYWRQLDTKSLTADINDRFLRYSASE